MLKSKICDRKIKVFLWLPMKLSVVKMLHHHWFQKLMRGSRYLKYDKIIEGVWNHYGLLPYKVKYALLRIVVEPHF